MADDKSADCEKTPAAWMCTRHLAGDRRVFDEPFIATNPDYVRVHKDYDWKPMSMAELQRMAADNPAAAESLTSARWIRRNQKGY